MKKFFACAIAAVAMLAACEPTDDKKDNTGDGGFIQQSFVDVYVDASATTWESVGVWAWSLEDNTNYTGGTWPGVALTEVKNIDGVDYYVWGAPEELVGQTIGFIANAFVEGGEQTIDLNLTVKADGNYVVLTEQGTDGKWLATVNGETAEAPEPTPEPVIAIADHTWGVIGVENWDADNFAMTVSGNTATATFDAGENAEFKVRADGGWDVDYGFAATEELTAAPVDGTAFPATFKAGNIKVVEAGNYTLTLTIEGEVETFTLTKN